MDAFINHDVNQYFYKVSRGHVDYTNIILEYTAEQDSTSYASALAVVYEIDDWLNSEGYDLSALSVHSDDQTARSVTYYSFQSSIDIIGTSWSPVVREVAGTRMSAYILSC